MWSIPCPVLFSSLSRPRNKPGSFPIFSLKANSFCSLSGNIVINGTRLYVGTESDGTLYFNGSFWSPFGGFQGRVTALAADPSATIGYAGSSASCISSSSLVYSLRNICRMNCRSSFGSKR